jgi:hypothetical protein
MNTGDSIARYREELSTRTHVPFFLERRFITEESWTKIATEDTLRYRAAAAQWTRKRAAAYHACCARTIYVSHSPGDQIQHERELELKHSSAQGPERGPGELFVDVPDPTEGRVFEPWYFSGS